MCTTERMRNHLINTARGFIFSTALPPAAVGASLEATRLARTKRHRAERALGFAARLRKVLGQPDQPSAIVPWVLGEPERALQAARELQARGFDARAVRPPTVPAGSARIRFTTGAHLHEVELDALIQALQDPLRELTLERRAALAGETP
jgi:8-amino-7-oxononanoate synthase